MTGYLIASDQTLGTLASACTEQDSSPCQINCEFEMDGVFAGTSGSLYHAFFFPSQGPITSLVTLARALWSATAQNSNEKKELNLQRKRKHMIPVTGPSPARCDLSMAGLLAFANLCDSFNHTCTTPCLLLSGQGSVFVDLAFRQPRTFAICFLR